MKINYVHNLNSLTVREIKKYQDSLKHNLTLKNQFEFSDIKICAGVDVAYWEQENKTYGACSIVLINLEDKSIVGKFSSCSEVSSEYIPGFLSIKELPLIIDTVSKIPDNLAPDLFIFDGNGILHPKNMGIASHASFFLNKPTIGVSKSCLKINNLTYIEPKNKNFAYTYIKINGKTKGVAFRSHKNTNPIFISPGNFIDLETSIAFIKLLINDDSKLPIATRYADIETHKLRKVYKQKILAQIKSSNK